MVCPLPVVSGTSLGSGRCSRRGQLSAPDPASSPNHTGASVRGPAPHRVPRGPSPGAAPPSPPGRTPAAPPQRQARPPPHGSSSPSFQPPAEPDPVPPAGRGSGGGPGGRTRRPVSSLKTQGDLARWTLRPGQRRRLGCSRRLSPRPARGLVSRLGSSGRGLALAAGRQGPSLGRSPSPVPGCASALLRGAEATSPSPRAHPARFPGGCSPHGLGGRSSENCRCPRK